MFAPAPHRRLARAHRAGFTTLAGELVPYAVGQAALRTGQALLVGTLLLYAP